MKLNFKNKISLGFLTIMAIVLLYIIYEVFQIENIRKETVRLYEHPILVRKSIKDINIELYKKAHLVYDLNYAKNKKQFDSIVLDMAICDSSITQNFKIVYERFLGNKRDIDTAWQFYIAFTNACSQIIELKHQNKMDSVQVLLILFNNNYVSEIQYKTLAIYNFAEHKTDELVYGSIDRMQNTLYFAIILIIILFLICFLIISIVTRSINFISVLFLFCVCCI